MRRTYRSGKTNIEAEAQVLLKVMLRCSCLCRKRIGTIATPRAYFQEVDCVEHLVFVFFQLFLKGKLGL